MERWVELSNNTSFSLINSFFDIYTKKILAFTLAETLIVMGIIGVVAALTIPNLNSNTNNMEKVAKVKKIYAELVQAHDRATAIYGPVETWFVNDNCDTSGNTACIQRYFDRLTESMKITKVCTESSYDDCKLVPFLLDESGYWNYGSYPGAVLANGSSFVISSSGHFPFHQFCDGGGQFGGQFGRTNFCGAIVIDLDGANKGKSQNGVDLFVFSITKDGIFPLYPNEVCKDDFSRVAEYGDCASSWVIEYGNMDYLKAEHASPYNCPDGTPLTWERGSCK